MNPIRVFHVITILCLGASCATSEEFNQAKFPTVPTPTPPPGPPKKEPDDRWICKVSNGAGRIFVAEADSSFEAQIKAKHECEIYSRRCSYLSCDPK